MALEVYDAACAYPRKLGMLLGVQLPGTIRGLRPSGEFSAQVAQLPYDGQTSTAT